jgi:hypothetical protein
MNVDLGAESHPFLQVSCENGYLKMQFSCLKPLEFLHLKIFLLEQEDKKWVEQDNDLFTGFEIIQQSIQADPARCRFLAHFVVPQIGSLKSKFILIQLKFGNLLLRLKSHSQRFLLFIVLFWSHLLFQ